ncbi:LOW QUALITY PROTEIN: mitochondrial amidoxime-reducing component 1 [Aplochiton taeniatus]
MDPVKRLVDALTQNKNTLLIIAGAGVSALGLGLAYKYFVKPEKVTRVGFVSQLLIHPLKSGKAVSVSLAECQKLGLKYGELLDRHWLVITEDGHMVTGRQEPSLVLVSLTVDEGLVCLKGPDMEELRLPFQLKDNRVINCRVFSSERSRQRLWDAAASWMAYPDSGPIMLLSEASVKDLSSHLDYDVTVNQFRPSIVVSGCEAGDSWAEIQIGNVRLQRVMACGRCIFTTVDPETGIKNRQETLEVLKNYRMCKLEDKSIYKKSPLFGQMYIVKKTGILQVGDGVLQVVR